MSIKRLFLPVLATLSVGSLMALAGCSKSSNNGTSGTLTCTINGTSWSAQQYKVGAGYIVSLSQLFVLGYNIQNKDSTEIQFVIPYIPPVNHPFSLDSTGSILSYLPPGKEYDANAIVPSSHGLITLTLADTVNHKIAGTFSGVLYNSINSSDSVTITNGTFTSAYTVTN